MDYELWSFQTVVSRCIIFKYKYQSFCADRLIKMAAKTEPTVPFVYSAAAAQCVTASEMSRVEEIKEDPNKGTFKGVRAVY